MNALARSITTIEARLDELAQSGPLSVAEAIEQAQGIADLVERTATLLEKDGDLEQAANLYEKAAHAFQVAAKQAPRDQRKHVASLGDLWSVKADAVRYATPPARQPQAPITGTLSPKAPPAAESKPLAGAFEMPGEGPSGRRSVTQPSSLAGRPKPWAGAFERSGEGPGERRSVIQSPSLAGRPKLQPGAFERPGRLRSVIPSPPLADEPKQPAMARLRQVLSHEKTKSADQTTVAGAKKRASAQEIRDSEDESLRRKEYRDG